MLDNLKQETNYTTTLNDAITHKSSESYVLDFFAQGGSLRNKHKHKKIELFSKAYSEDKELALKTLFYFRDIREGQGERQLFIDILEYLGNKDPDVVRKNLELIPEYGRWDDLYALVKTPVWSDVIDLFDKQLKKDLKSEYPSLLAKWLKSENTSSKKSRNLARKTLEGLGMTEREYRKTLSALRKKIDVVEIKMSENRWNEIDYSKVPSQAFLKYRRAFLRNDSERYLDFIEKVHKGEVSIKTETLYPYQIIRGIEDLEYAAGYYEGDKVLDTLWDNLPNYVRDENSNDIAVVDTSGSMYAGFYGNVLPIYVSISLGIYFAERNKGIFKDHFITFSDKPELVEIIGNGVCEKARNMTKANWGYNTDIEAVFDLLLDTAKKHNLDQEELPKRLFIISDMEFDKASGYIEDKETLMKSIERKWKDLGYKIPQLVFWNVDAKTSQVPVTKTDEGVILVSGCSPVIFEKVLSGDDINPYDMMLEILNSERYSKIKI